MYRLLIIALIGGLVAPPALAKGGDEIPCTPIYVPAKPGYDFTAAVDHWGQKKTRYDFDGTEIVGQIYINSLPIFNTASPKENNALYRWIDEIHPRTRPYVIRELILFHEGGPITNRLIDESERILRQQKFTGDASIRAISKCGNKVDIEVITKEVWTLVPEVSVGTAGGKTQSSVGVHDSNFLGTGSQITLGYAHNVDRDSALFRYQDFNVRGSRIHFLTHLEENTDGYVRRLLVDLPFYELDAKQSWGVAAGQSKESDHQYQRGQTISYVDTENEHFEGWLGHSAGLVNDWANRFNYGVVYDRTRYGTLTGLPAPPVLPTDRTLVYPFFEFQQIENKYTVAYNIKQIKREEDIHIGRSLRTRFGFSQIDEPRLIAEGDLATTLISREKELFQASVDWRGRWNFNLNQSEDVHVNLSLDYHHGQTPKRSLHFKLRVTDTWHRSPETQVLLGGATGLRGYPIHYAAGDASYLFTAEQQIFTNYSIFSLFNVGFVAFLDTGRAWYKGNGGPDDGELTDVGFGARLVPAKTDKDHVIHIDVGWPLKRLPGAQGVQVIIEVQKTI